MDRVVLGSRTGVQLEFQPTRRSYDFGRGEMPSWRARLYGFGLDATLACNEEGWQPRLLWQFFESLDADWRGWDGERVWQSGEAEVRLTATHDKTNTVVIRAELEDGAPPRWRAEADLELDPGVFARISKDVKRLGETSLTL